ncbi:TetR family transcriptional regulator [Nocardioides panacisoli]|uniref:TetR/AcrR family transcriptional regulator n=1 Tax=Nocardioides panacisoli TaxID=627624 RepID=UPI001C639F15|nr:TetR family transcriptional regulator [Nocardioides panacisoli]QYJ02851.1 TetR family transcriptional regulator [Nocardioides panacisoli]
MYKMLYVRTTTDDLAAPARIRAAAIRLFAESGFEIGLRAIADEAGVSLGLIRHHFGSKAGLREACDTWVLDDLLRAQEEHAGPEARGLLEQFGAMEEYGPLVQYVMQALRAGGPTARAFWHRMLADGETYLEQGVADGTVKPSRDPAGRARVLTLMELGALLLELALAPEGEEFAVTWRRYLDGFTLPGLELFTQGLLADDTILDSYLAHLDAPTTQEQP